MTVTPAPQDSPFAALHPRDVYNDQLAANVHPADWTNPTPTRPYHLVVIGAGTAGLVTAAGAAGLGARVALVERGLMGGDCLNVGCVPSKALLHAARVAAGVRTASESGVSVPAPSVDFAQVMARMRRLRAHISPHDSAQRFRDLGVDVFLGQATFDGDRSLTVTSPAAAPSQLQFKKAVIASGARAAAPPIPGLRDVEYLTNETLFSLTELPQRFGVIGAGPIGCEMAQAFARFGSEVFLFDRGQRLLPRDDPRASNLLTEQFRREGIQLVFGADPLHMSPGAMGGIQIVAEVPGDRQSVSVDQVLVAVGRAPNVEELNLSAVGVGYDASGIHVNAQLQTDNPHIYAAGDVCSQHKFTHAADFQARLVIQNALFALGPLGRKKHTDLLIPWATYTSPEVAHVGLSQTEAEERGIAFDAYVQELGGVDRALLEGQEHGFVKVLTKPGSDRILGATIVADSAGDLISEVTLAMQGGLGLSQIGATIHPYPTHADALRKLGDQFSRTKLTPFSKRVLQFLLRLKVGR